MTTVSNERLTFTEAGAHGNCVISPENGQGPYFTLIGGGSDEEQNALAAKICDAVNALRAQGGVRVKPLEWHRSEIIGWNGDWHTVPTAYSIRCADENGWKWSGFGGFGYERSDEAAKTAAQADYERRILASLEASPAPVSEPTHRHKKRGTEYVLIGIGKMQAENWEIPHHDEGGYLGGELIDMHEVAIYRSATDPTEIWVRPREEFEDGRFEALTGGSNG